MSFPSNFHHRAFIFWQDVWRKLFCNENLDTFDLQNWDEKEDQPILWSCENWNYFFFVIYLFVILIRGCVLVGIAFWPESHSEDFFGCTLLSPRVSLLKQCFGWLPAQEFLFIAGCESLQWIGYIPYFQSMDSLFADLSTRLCPQKIEMNV